MIKLIIPADIVCLNSELLFVAQKYKLFNGALSALEVLQKKLNFEVLQKFLRELDEQFLDAQSHLAELQNFYKEFLECFKTIEAKQNEINNGEKVQMEKQSQEFQKRKMKLQMNITLLVSYEKVVFTWLEQESKLKLLYHGSFCFCIPL